MADDGNTGAGEDTSDSLPMIPAVTDQEKDIGNMVSYFLLPNFGVRQGPMWAVRFSMITQFYCQVTFGCMI